MGIWEFMGSTAEAVKQNVPLPGTTQLKNAYNYGFATVVNIDQAARVNGLRRIGDWIPSDDAKSKMSLYATKFAQNAGHYALKEGYKLVPGGVAFSKILNKTLNDVKHENLSDKKIKVLEEKIDKLEKHSIGVGRAEMHGGGGLEFESKNAPEDVIRLFMMKEFIGNRYLEDLIVPKISKGKKPE
ncbi:hypothetical protein ACJIZ3_007430 [Penstemon smallii]|uniref:Uncharacterized protein n=1 Tax=Penstemon smallii TaxID=265156 RepID=A0ABD3SAI6_9LAMI